MDCQKDLITEYDRESAKTRKVLDAIPADVDFAYKPHPKSMALGQLAGHIADMSGDWAVTTMTQDKLEITPDQKWVPYIPTSKQALLEKFDSELPKAREALSTASPEKWDQHWQLIWNGQKVIDSPRHQVLREMVINHVVHHRAQLGVYLRLLGAKVPGCYGPSADEM